jgi:hypothetical protein
MWKDYALLAIGALVLGACCSKGKFPSDMKAGTPIARVDRDEHVEEWRVNGEDVCPKVLATVDGCYVLEAKYSASYLRLHGAHSAFWTISPILAVADTADRLHEAHYESEFVPFALVTHKQYAYYVTSTFTGDEFIPRIVELNGAGERVREIKPAKSTQELDACHAGWSTAR